MRSGQCRWRCPLFVCVPSVGASLCLSFRLGVGAQKKPPVKEAFWLWIKKSYFFMMRVVAMPLAVATRTTYTPGARLSTLACCPTVVATRLPAAL